MSLDPGGRVQDSGRLLAGRYRLVAPLGRGGMGAVWRAVDEVLDREVAVKELLVPHGVRDEDRAALRERSLREARIAARLRHPALVTVHDVVIEQDTPHIVMELVPSRSLQDTVAADGALPPIRVAEIGLAVLAGLRAVHAAGVLHRDVKPSNVLLGTDGRVMLADFGVARFEGDPRLTLTGQLLGSPGYIAPEFGKGAAAATPAADLWSLGATLYTAVEGRPPYDRDSFFAVLTAAATEDPEPMRLAGPLTPVISGLLERDPARRLDAEAAERTLQEVARGLDGTATVRISTGRPATRADSPRGRRPRVGLAVVAAAGCLLVAGTGIAAVTGLDPAGTFAGGDPDLDRAGPPTAAASSPPARAGDVPPSAVPASPASPRVDIATRRPSSSLSIRLTTHVDRGLGFSMRVPQGWTRSTAENYVLFTGTGGSRGPDLLVARNPAFPGGSLRNLEAIDRELSAKNAANSYKRLRLEAVPAPGGEDWADLEFSMVRFSRDGVVWRVVDRNITTRDGVSYAVRFRITDAEWPQAERSVRGALASFRSAAAP